MANYNVWYEGDVAESSRWTNYGQDPDHPHALTLKEAQQICQFLNGRATGFSVRELLPDGTPGQVMTASTEPDVASSEPINITPATIDAAVPAEKAFDFDTYNSSLPGRKCS